MLDSLPPEIIEQILGHLPTVSSIANVARTNRKLHSIVAADEYGIFRNFVQRAFPSIATPPLWRNSACALTSRSRAWDRRSFIARECHPPHDDAAYSRGGAYQAFGYIPVMDSYEHWSGGHRKQVLAYGAGGRLQLRTTEKNGTEWKTFRLTDDYFVSNEILGVNLLKPHQHQNLHGETIILRRANREIVKLESGGGKDNFSQTSSFLVDGTEVDCVDVNKSTEPLMAVCNKRTLQLFPVGTAAESIQPLSVLKLAQEFNAKYRMRSMRFLDEHVIAAGVQFVEGRERAPILIYDVSPSGITATPFQPVSNIDPEHSIKGRHSANTIVGLDHTASLSSRPGQVFISGWTDGITRLHDRRTPSQVVAQYVDYVDDGQILSLATVGHERFFAGSHQNACLKCFDMRMPGARPYSYLNAQPSRLPPKTNPAAPAPGDKPKMAPERDINIFLALPMYRNHNLAPVSHRRHAATIRTYRGSVYSLSVPSPSSATLFAGIENHVIQFDFVGTDDILKQHLGPCDPAAGLSTLTQTPEIDDVLSLSCYERPRDSHHATDPVLLRKQVEWQKTVHGVDDSQYGVAEEGWDHRWRMTRLQRNQGGQRRWRNGNTT